MGGAELPWRPDAGYLGAHAFTFSAATTGAIRVERTLRVTLTERPDIGGFEWKRYGRWLPDSLLGY